MVSLRVLTPPESTPVSPADLAAYLKLAMTSSDYSALASSEKSSLALMVQAATEAAEAATGRAFLTQTLELTAGPPQGPWMFGYSALYGLLYGRIHLLRQPVQSITSITVDGVTATPSHYTLYESEGYVAHATGYSPWYTGQRVVVTYTAGYGDDAESVPAPIRQGILKRAATYYEHREEFVVGAVVSAVGDDAARLWRPYRVVNV